MENLALVEGLEDVVAGRDEEEGGEEEGKGGESCGVEDAKERNAEGGEVHGKDTGGGCMIIGIMMLGGGWQFDCRVDGKAMQCTLQICAKAKSWTALVSCLTIPYSELP